MGLAWLCHCCIHLVHKMDPGRAPIRLKTGDLSRCTVDLVGYFAKDASAAPLLIMARPNKNKLRLVKFP